MRKQMYSSALHEEPVYRAAAPPRSAPVPADAAPVRRTASKPGATASKAAYFPRASAEDQRGAVVGSQPPPPQEPLGRAAPAAQMQAVLGSQPPPEALPPPQQKQKSAKARSFPRVGGTSRAGGQRTSERRSSGNVASRVRQALTPSRSRREESATAPAPRRKTASKSAVRTKSAVPAPAPAPAPAPTPPAPASSAMGGKKKKAKSRIGSITSRLSRSRDDRGETKLQESKLQEARPVRKEMSKKKKKGKKSKAPVQDDDYEVMPVISKSAPGPSEEEEEDDYEVLQRAQLQQGDGYEPTPGEVPRDDDGYDMPPINLNAAPELSRPTSALSGTQPNAAGGGWAAYGNYDYDAAPLKFEAPEASTVAAQRVSEQVQAVKAAYAAEGRAAPEAPPVSEMCANCEEDVSAFYCLACETSCCSECDGVLHKAPSKRAHKRVPLQSDPELGGGEVDSRDKEWAGAAQQFTIERAEVSLRYKLGEGYFGTVYRGLWQQQDVALKKLKTGVRKGDEANFRREVQALCQLRHPNTLGFFGVTRGSDPLIVTEFMAGGSLSGLLHESGLNFSVPDKLRRRMARDVACGLSYLHSRAPPMVHRDLSSSNVLVAAPAEALMADPAAAAVATTPLCKISDFGLTRSVAWYMTTATGNLLYSAPEVFRGELHTEASDVYSFGVLLWEVFAQRPPFDGDNPQAVAFQVAQEDRRPQLPAAATPDIRRMIQRCWARDPQARPTAAEVVAGLPVCVPELTPGGPTPGGPAAEYDAPDGLYVPSDAAISSPRMSEVRRRLHNYLRMRPRPTDPWLQRLLSPIPAASARRAPLQERAARTLQRVWRMYRASSSASRRASSAYSSDDELGSASASDSDSVSDDSEAEEEEADSGSDAYLSDSSDNANWRRRANVNHRAKFAGARKQMAHVANAAAGPPPRSSRSTSRLRRK